MVCSPCFSQLDAYCAYLKRQQQQEIENFKASVEAVSKKIVEISQETLTEAKN